jgi:hypothetical protein
MKCSKISDLLGPYVDGELSPEERRTVEEHLRRCPACRAELEELRRIETAGRRTVPPDPGEEYWNTFLPRLRERIGSEQRRPAPAGWGRRIRRLFEPPVPWVRLAGAVAAAVLVMVIGRAFIDRRGDLVPMRSPAGRPPTDQVRTVEGDFRKEPYAGDSAAADRERERRTVVIGEAAKATGTADQDEAPAPVAPPSQPAAPPGPTDSPELLESPQPAEPPEQREEPEPTVPPETAEPPRPSEVSELSPEDRGPAGQEKTGFRTGTSTDAATDAMTAEERVDEGLPAPAISQEAAQQEEEPAARTMARSAAGPDRREQIQHWQTVIDSASGRNTLAAAHLALAESWYHLSMDEPNPENITAALEAHRTALEYAAEDSLRLLLQQRISRLNDRRPKK